MEHLEDGCGIISKIQGTTANDDKESIEYLSSDTEAIQVEIEAVGYELEAVKYCLLANENENMGISEEAMKMVEINASIERIDLQTAQSQSQRSDNQPQEKENLLFKSQGTISYLAFLERLLPTTQSHTPIKILTPFTNNLKLVCLLHWREFVFNK